MPRGRWIPAATRDASPKAALDQTRRDRAKTVLHMLARCMVLTLTGIQALGCQGPAYQASRLPAELRAKSRPTRGVINLAGVASPGIGDSVIGAGDLLEVTIASGREDEKVEPVLARVTDDGTADIPLVGPVPVAGLEPNYAGHNVAAAAVQRGIYLRPHVAVEIRSKAVNHVTVLGAVSEPGAYEVPRNSSDLVHALALAGGLNDDAGTVVEIIRQPPLMMAVAAPALADSAGNPGGVQQAVYSSAPNGNQPPSPPTQRIEIDLSKTLAPGDYRIGDRDVVMVRPRDEELVYVSGLVKEPGQFEIPHDKELHLLEAIAMAGGETSPVADKVLIIRRKPGTGESVPIRASLAECKRNSRANLMLVAGDAISIERTPATVVVDTVMQMLRFSVGLSGRTALF